MYEIVVGRSESERKSLGLQGAVYLGRHYVRMGPATSLSNKIYLDVARTHVVLVAGKRGSGKCLTGDTLIQLEDGSLTRIDQLKEDSRQILSINEKLKIMPTAKTEYFERTVDKILKIRLRSGKELKLTPEHPLLTIKGWKEVQSLQLGSRIATPRILPCFGNENLEDYKIKLLAYLIAEGHTKKVALFANTDTILIEEFGDCLKQLDSRLELRKEKEGHYRITIPKWTNKVLDITHLTRDNLGRFTKGSKIEIEKRSIRKLIEKYKLFNKLSIEKDIPEEITRLNKEKLSLFLNRLFSCDGSIYPLKDKGWEISYCSSSYELIKKVQNLILRFGILSKLRHKNIKCNKKIFKSFELVINGDNISTFIQEIGFFGSKKQREPLAIHYLSNRKANPNVDTIPKDIWELYKPNNWAELGRQLGYAHPKAIRERIKYSPSRQTLLQISIADQNAGLKTLAESDIFWDEILSLELIETETKVYDLCVPDLHNFVANDIIVHNSYSLGVIAEEMAHLPDDVKNKLAVLMIDTMGIFWTMRFPNVKEEDLLDEWGLPKKSLDISIYVPAGYYKEYKEKEIPADFAFTINPGELDPLDWCNSFGISLNDPTGVAIESTVAKLKEKKPNFSVQEVIQAIEDNINLDDHTKLATINRFIAAKERGIFSEQSTPIKNIVAAGKVSVLDISAYKEWNVKALVTGIVCKKLMQERVIARKKEEMEDVRRGHSYFQTKVEGMGEELPMVWILVDELHEFLPKDRITAATDALVTILREGRQPGISLIGATQQPGEIHKDVITQTDIVISHRLTAKRDLVALNSMMQSYLYGDMTKYFNLLPRMRGSAIILDDNSERIYPLQVRPRFTWHGGEAPTAIKQKGKAAAELDI